MLHSEAHCTKSHYNLCLLVINREEGIIAHDKHIAGYAEKSGKGLIIVVNKWDTVDNKDQDIKNFTKDIREEFKFIPYAPSTHIATINKVKITIYNNAVHMIAFTLLIYCSSSFNFWHKRVDLFL